MAALLRAGSASHNGNGGGLYALNRLRAAYFEFELSMSASIHMVDADRTGPDRAKDESDITKAQTDQRKGIQ